MNEVIDLLENLLRQAAELADELSPEEMAEVENIFAQAIELIQQEEPIVTPKEPIPLAPHESSQINGFAYDPETGKLQVQFHGKYPQAAGSEYEYDDVPPWVFDLFQRGAIGPKTSGENRWHRWEKGKTPSHGAAMNALIKAGGFNYRKMS
jgi:hypothetical protein